LRAGPPNDSTPELQWLATLVPLRKDEMPQSGSLRTDTRICGEDSQEPISERNSVRPTSGTFDDQHGVIDDLFREPEIRQLLHDVASDLREVDKFITRIHKELKAEAPGPGRLRAAVSHGRKSIKSSFR